MTSRMILHVSESEKLPVDVYTLPDEVKSLVHVSGIYFLIARDGGIDYIGRSVNIFQRLTNHHVYDKREHRCIWVYEIPFLKAWTHKYTENSLIKHYCPPKNENASPLQSIKTSRGYDGATRDAEIKKYTSKSRPRGVLTNG